MKETELYDYQIYIKPWYPSYSIVRRLANTEGKWEVVANGASNREVLKDLIVDAVEDILSSKH